MRRKTTKKGAILLTKGNNGYRLMQLQDWVNPTMENEEVVLLYQKMLPWQTTKEKSNRSSELLYHMHPTYSDQHTFYIYTH